MALGFGLLPKNCAIVAGKPADWSENRRNHAGHVELERQMRALPLHHAPPTWRLA
jgi:hypothetical protein